jgi:hypothetical protein
MLTVNLEKELLKQNARVNSPSELLKIKEYERLGSDICEDEILNRIGINKAAKDGLYAKEHNRKIEKHLQKYNQERVFHISQIESLCKKYHLRFLSSHYYSGSIDKNLANKISTYEVAYGEICKEENTYIAAPKSAFTLQSKPKDPLFFKGIGYNYYYLIHKWGNDLSIFRRCLNWLSSPFIIPVIYFGLFLGLFIYYHDWKDYDLILNVVLCFLALIICAGIYASIVGIKYLIKGEDEFTLRIVPKNNWNSFYND